MNQDPRYPIGRFERPSSYPDALISGFIQTIKIHPAELQRETGSLADEMLDTPYRDGGWTIRQVVHHLADSHMNAYIRFKLAYSEENPVIKPYQEGLWAETADGKSMPVNVSLMLLKPLHERWVFFITSLADTDLEKTYFHPESKRDVSLKEALALYAWHCNHHLGHIKSIKKQKGW